MAGPGYETPPFNPQPFSYTPMKFDPGSESELRPESFLATPFSSTYVVFFCFSFSLIVGAAECP